MSPETGAETALIQAHKICGQNDNLHTVNDTGLNYGALPVEGGALFQAFKPRSGRLRGQRSPKNGHFPTFLSEWPRSRP